MNVSMYIYVCIYNHVYAFTYIYIYTYRYMPLRVSILFVCKYAHDHIYVYMYILYIFIYIYIYIHDQRSGKNLAIVFFSIVVALPPTKYRNPKTDKELIVTLISVTICSLIFFICTIEYLWRWVYSNDEI